MDERHVRNRPAITPAEQAQLKAASVCVVGCGGLGGYIIEYLARLGIGRLVLVDGDVFEPSNLNRQLLSTVDAMGRSKTSVAAERVRAIDPDISVVVYDQLFTEENGPGILEGCQLAMDALDSVPSRLVLARCCDDVGIPLIHGAIQGWNVQVTVCMPGSRRMEELYPRVFEASKCSLAFTPPLCAALQVAEAVKLLLDREPSLKDSLFLGDLEDMRFIRVEM